MKPGQPSPSTHPYPEISGLLSGGEDSVVLPAWEASFHCKMSVASVCSVGFLVV